MSLLAVLSHTGFKLLKWHVSASFYLKNLNLVYRVLNCKAAWEALGWIPGG